MILLFAGENFYPSGGWEDYQGTFPTMETALEKLKDLKPIGTYSGFGWAHIVFKSEIVRRFVAHGSENSGCWKEIKDAL